MFYSNCPLWSSCLFITNHSTQCIITATDELLNLSGYSMPDVVDQPITQFIQLSSKLSLIPECTLKHSDGHLITFQCCIHQEDRLSYWLLKPMMEQEEQQQLMMPSIIGLNCYGTIEQVHNNSHFKQPMYELIGRPIMTFIYHDDVQILCGHLSAVLHQRALDHPVCLRWSNQYDFSLEESISYDWMSFTFISSYNRPICIVRPLRSCGIDKHSLLCDVILYIQEMIEYSKSYVKEYIGFITSYLLNQDNLIGYFIKSNSITKKSIGLIEFILGQ